ncbi:hypothetical protein [Streptomyces tsukubensis]|uniref:Uncharacterized protein n=1 Tax=Streptomyces tsukubensis TaxID=83656 RepID=A0A1V4AE20_9ACTN|nr:hypothetical protein [Streptomyces tsukubensis]OON82225.1 hypothetical protein B1H18_04075 [Streptomyces tsukubensis]QFR92714.1 hypothetical protein GBW32_06100 [Streptomyces tsukubensis]
MSPPAASARFPDTAPTRPTTPATPATPTVSTTSAAPAPLAPVRRAAEIQRPAGSPGASPRSGPGTSDTPAPAGPPPRPPSRRPVGAVDLTAGPGAGAPFARAVRPETYDDTTTRLRPIAGRRASRAVGAAACLVLGLGLIGGAVTGSWLTGDAEGPAPRSSYRAGGELWHSAPVDQLFPAVLKGGGAGPGGADRTWTRIAVAPDSDCSEAFDPLLRKVLAPVGCLRLLRATYSDATRSHVTTVGLLFTKSGVDGMRALRARFSGEKLDRRTDLMPRPYAAGGTVAADFGDQQRASWSVSVLTDVPVVVTSVSGFADGRTVSDPQAAADAVKSGATSTPAQAGLGHEAKGVADRVERLLRASASTATEQP